MKQEYVDIFVNSLTAIILREKKDEFSKLLIDTVRELSPREQKILEMRFGLTDGTNHLLEDVGQEFGVTRERIRQIENMAIEKIGCYLFNKINHHDKKTN